MLNYTQLITLNKTYRRNDNYMFTIITIKLQFKN